MATLVALAAAGTASAQITNGSFETGTLTGWTAGGTGRVQVISATGVNPSITPFDGSYFAVLSTGPGNAGGSATSLDGQGGSNDYDLATLQQTFTLTTAPAGLQVAVMFLTSEGDQGAAFDDLFDVTINEAPLFRHSVLKNVTGASPWPDFGPYDNTQYLFTAPGPIQNTQIRGGAGNGRTEWYSTCVTLATPGNYTLRFRVADQGDATFDSALAVDAVAVPACTPQTAQVTVSAGWTVELKGGGLEARPTQSREVAAGENPPSYVFISSGNLTGDNPGAVEQVYFWSGGTLQRLTAASGGSFSHPAVTSNGRFVVFASNANLTGGNTDGNWEIFRVDRTTLTTVQVTSTTAPCQNRFPVVAGDGTGTPVVFVSNCGHGTFTNPDGNDEIVAWNGTTFAGTSTSSCQNYAPSVSRSTGQFVAFVSTCNIGGTNPDGNPEIYRWDRTANTFQAITTTSGAIFNDTPAISASGAAIAFISNGNFAGGNGDGGYELFFWPSGTIRQLSAGPATEAYIMARLTDDGAWAVGERLDFLSGTFTARYFATATSNQPGVGMAAAPTPLAPTVSRNGAVLYAAWQSDQNPLGSNADGNYEIFRYGPATGPPRYLLCAAPNAAIPDNSPTGVTSTVSAPAGWGVVTDVDVWLLITHPRVGDLNAFLTSPAGTTRQLMNRLTNGSGGCQGDNVDAMLDDEATGNVQVQCGNLPAVSGFFYPFQALSAFDGQTSPGTWQLRVEDRANGQTGTLERWCLALTVQ
ncbi:MAG: proprotein convertase P-domain-containing protein [Thermoanaerobaculum sp.]|nr:proprotein convertase P-domain-containing protein [Thermoanaerobaculum sp.]MDW7967976.1 proprotein convertase P-domain-containing protein [Thermoanaerobaculum sp.]